MPGSSVEPAIAPQATSRGYRKRARTRQQLIEAARQFLAANQLADASILDLATAAGVSNGTFYNYFDSKDQLLEALALEMSNQLASELRTEFVGVKDPAARIVIAARTFMHKARAEPVFGRALLRMAGTLPEWSATIRASVLLDVKDGMQCGRFAVPSAEAGADLVLGTLLAGVRTLLELRVGEEHLQHIGELSLQGLGMDPPSVKQVVADLFT